MKRRISTILKGQKGFTLAELIMVVAVIAVIGSVVGVGIYGYMKSAYTLKANQTAKTVFYATQNYLADQKEKGALKEFNKQAKGSGAELSQEGQIIPMLEGNGFSAEDISKFKEQHKSSKFRYLYLDGAAASGTNPRSITDKKTEGYNVLYDQILEPYVKDTDITNESFLVEYDSVSGVVMSVFYSEKIEGFINGRGSFAPYNESVEAYDNVRARGKGELSNKWQGYYGIYKTNLQSESIQLSAPEVQLINGERLILKWKDTNRTNAAFITNSELKKMLYYEVELTSTNRGADENPLSIKIPKVKQGTGVATNWEEEDSKNITEGDPLFIYYESDGDRPGEGTYELLLDCMHHSILEQFSGVQASDMLKGTVTAKLEDTASTQGKATSNLQSAAYGGGETNTQYAGEDVGVGGSGNTKENGVRPKEIFSFALGEDLSYTIKNARHFNNMRHVTADKDFMQTGDINWAKVEDKDNEKFFEPFVFVENEKTKGKSKTALHTDATFTGSYRVKEKQTISNVKISVTAADKGANIGIFAINGGEISGMHLVGGSVTGVSNVGSVAGTNNTAGSITEVKVDAMVAGYYPSDNAPTTTEEKNKYGKNIGGIIGVNQGKATKLTTGTKTVSGRQNVGGVIGSHEATKAKAEQLTNANMVTALQDAQDGWENFGGIAGYNKAGSTLVDCENKTAVQLNQLSTYSIGNQPSFIGGVVGYNEGNIDSCTIQDTATDIENKANECIGNLNSENGKLPEFFGTFVGGIAGVNTGENALIAQCSVNAYVTGYSFVGGITGANLNGVIRAKGSNDDVDGLIIATGNMAGGIAAYTNGDLQSLQNGADVFGDSMVGGVTGFHGLTFDTVDALATYNWDAYFVGKEENTTAYYEALFTIALGVQIDRTRQISDCTNQGFVYAQTRYSGGITGVNQAVISNSYCDMNSESNDYVDANASLLRKADCVGGIAGLNQGSISAATRVETDSVVYGRSFSGGVVGCNLSDITGYEQVRGSVFGSGDYVGGLLGLNTNAQIVSSELVKTGNGAVAGRNYVAGLIGGNMIQGHNVENTIDIQANAESGTTIEGEAYVGGILGYHTILTGNESLATACSTMAKRSPYEAYNSNTSRPSGQASQVQTNMSCTNRSTVEGFRYVGGIIGLNEENSRLTVRSSKNYGTISIDEARMKESQIKILEDVISADDVTGTSYFIGGITGRNTSDGLLSYCYNNGRIISPSRYLGGLCEINEGMIQDCTIGDEQSYQTGVEGTNSVGGITGLNQTVDSNKPATVIRCYANQYATIKGGSNTGGLVGTNKASVQDCKSFAQVTSTGNNVGGLVGVNQGSMQNNMVGSTSYAPYVSGHTKVGGFVGDNIGAGEEISGLTNYANVSGKHLVGGIVGSHSATSISECANYGMIKATGQEANGCAGGITGINDAKKSISKSQNFGTIVSDESKAGGIAGWNKGTIQDSENKGTIQGAYKGNGQDAIGGITGTNDTGATVENCTSLANITNTNYINGSAMVGGLVGQNKGLVKTDADTRAITIAIRVTQNVEVPSYIGGVIGRDGTGAYINARGDQKELDGFTFSGSIYVWEGASKVQYIGGIIGASEGGYTVNQCQFTGEIKGKGNASDSASTGGVGGISGYNGGVIVLNSVPGDTTRYAIAHSKSKTGVVEGNVNVGGIVGVMQGGTIQCTKQIISDASHLITNYTTVTGVRNVGGFMGRVMIGGSNYAYMRNQGTISGSDSVGGAIGIHSANIESQQNVLEHMQNEAQGTILAIGKAQNLGGIAGSGRYKINQCENYGVLGKESDTSVQDVKSVGGIIGSASKTVIEYSGNSGKIYLGSMAVGGIAGSGDDATLKNCYNRKDALVAAPSSQIGGIVGRLTNSNTLENCINEGQVLLKDHARAGKNDMQVGGIVGTVFSNNQAQINRLEKCENKGEVLNNLSKTFLTNYANLPSTGGIAGYYISRTSITNCKNSGKVDAGIIAKTGGIIGRYNAITVQEGGAANLIQGNHNTGSVKGGDDTGGMVGYQESFDGLSFKKNVNGENGTVTGGTGTGGLIGNLYNYKADSKVGAIEDCENMGKVIAQDTTANHTGSVTGIGGILGRSSSYGVTIKNSKNSGQITLLPEITTAESIGGILGTSPGLTIEKCINSASLDFTSSNANITNIGGIAGKVQASGTYRPIFRDCQNTNSIKGTKTDKTGGIVGDVTNGDLIACKNLAPKGTESIQGGSRVGGIAGVISDPNAKIMGELGQNGTNNSCNEQTIQGDDIVGGIAGEQNRSVFYTVYNAGDVYTTTNMNAAGGLIGLSKDAGASENTGLVINCYNLGTVGTTATTPEGSVKGFVGGLVGFRENNQARYDRNKTAVNDNNICSSTVIKDSYCLIDNVEETLPATIMNNTTLTKQRLAVGNEPFIAFKTPHGDSQGSPIEKTGRFEWSQATYENMILLINQTTSWDAQDPKGNIQVLLDHYFYQLPVPKGLGITGVEGHTYNMEWVSQVGLNSGLEVSLYDQDYTKEELPEKTALHQFTVSEQTTEGVNIEVPGHVAQAYMGKPLYVATKAKGYQIESIDEGIDDIDITFTSEHEIVQSFVLMPPLPQPQIDISQEIGSMKVTLTIQNISNYLSKPNVDYPILADLKEGEVYSAYKNGLDRFVIQDYYRSTENEGEFEYKRKERVITGDQIDWATNTASITIDYASAEEQMDNRLYHTYRLQAAISKDMEQQSLLPAPSLTYRYLSSTKSLDKYKVLTESFLLAPVELGSTYTGTLTDPSFRLEWKAPQENQGKTAGYEVTITNKDNQRTKQISISGEGTLSYDLTQADLIELIDSFAYGGNSHALSFAVTAKAQGDHVKDSLASEVASIVVPMKQKTPEQLVITTPDKEFSPNMIKVEWKDLASEILDTRYQISLLVNGQPPASDVIYLTETTETYCLIQLPNALIASLDAKIEVTVKKAGNRGTSLDSEAVTHNSTVYKRLPQITEVTVSQQTISEDPTKVNYQVSWNVPAEINEQSCSGYLLAQLPANELEMGKAEITRIPGANIKEQSISFDISSIGSGVNEVIFYIYALGMEGVSSTSLPKEADRIILPTQRAPASTGMQVQLQDYLGNPLGSVVDETTLHRVKSVLTWNNPSMSELLKISGHRLVLKDENGKIVPLKGAVGDARFVDIAQVLERATVEVNLLSYQGQKMTWSVINKPSATGTLASEPIEIEFTVPSIPPIPVE